MKNPVLVDYESDIDPDDLLPRYIDYKTKLFHLQSTAQESSMKGISRRDKSKPRVPASDPEASKLLLKIKHIEADVLFDKYPAEQEWQLKRIALEKGAAAERAASDRAKKTAEYQDSADSDENEVSQEAARMGLDLLEEESDDEGALADLFASLPVNEVDPTTGKTLTVVNENNGTKVVIRDFGKWTGMSPTRILEEACRAR